MSFFVKHPFFLIIILPLLSCSNAIVQEPNLKGEFKVLEVQPISGQINNIIKNGSFTEWLSGTRVPSGFLPPFSEYSFVNKRAKKESGYVVIHKWRKADAETNIDNMFRISISDLQPNNYIFAVNAILLKGPKVNIGIWRIAEPGKIVPYINPLLEISGEMEKPINLEREFRIEQEDTYFFCTYAPEGTPQIIWSDWILSIAPENNP